MLGQKAPMAIDIFQSFTNPVSKETFKGISFDETAFIMEWTVQPGGYVPFEHIHLYQDEIFHVKNGEIRLVMDGKEYIAKKGDTITVPKGARHIAYNNRDATLHCVVEYRPGLDHDKMMQCVAGLTLDGHYDKKGEISIPKMGYFLRRMNCKAMVRPTKIPAAAMKMGLMAFYLRGALAGWGKLYEKYVG